MHNRQTCRSITLRVCSYAYRFQRVESGTAGANMHGRFGCSAFPRCALCLTGAQLGLLSVCRYIETFQAGFDEGLKKVPVYFMQARLALDVWHGSGLPAKCVCGSSCTLCSGHILSCC